jgi:hypothetical protein
MKTQSTECGIVINTTLAKNHPVDLRHFIIGGGAMARSLWITRIFFTTLLIVSTSPLTVLAEAINDPSAQANIHATHITSNFASEINSGQYYTNPITKREYYLIGSTDSGHEKTTPSVNTTVVANETEIIQPASNVTTLTTKSEIETIQPVGNKTTSITINTYNTLIIIANNKTEAIQPVANNTTSQKIPSGSRNSDGGSPTGQNVLGNYKSIAPTSQKTSIIADNLASNKAIAATRSGTISGVA